MEEEGQGIKRRDLLGGFFGLLGLSALSPLEAFAKKALKALYVVYKKQLCLKIKVKTGENYSSIADLYTGSERNTDNLIRFNDRRRLKPDDYLYIPTGLVRNSIRRVLDENKFVIYEISSQGEPGINNLWELIKEFMADKPYNFYEKRAIILTINQDINPIKGIVYDEQKILVPASLVEKDLIEEEPKSPKGIKAPIQVTTPTSKTRQNPFRSSRQDVLENIRPRDKFGARRIRSSGRGRYSVTKHKGLDLVASIGTPLYPVESGTLLYLGKERNRKLWRNGIVAEYRTNSGILVKYIHLSWVNKKIKSGQAIELNAFLGKVGITGNASKDNPHVHIQVIVAGRIVDPFPYVVI
ncbi:M23 family metallopeptidase [Candidatus Woesearchaeota archaeon]|nr:M23 family metallopeptidase [Candidatus Woesearchaeota archaeon]